MAHDPQPCIAAVRYISGQKPKCVFADFAKRLLEDGVKVHGLLQENVIDENGHRIGVDAIDIVTNTHIPLLRPTSYELNNKLCSLNLAQLAEATGVLRRAIEDKADIAIIERFGKTESDGGGLVDDLLLLMASGIPTLVSVSHDEWNTWIKASGGLGVELDCDIEAFAKWWDSSKNKRREF